MKMTKGTKLSLLARATMLEVNREDAEDVAMAGAMAEMFLAAAERFDKAEEPGRCAEAIWALARQAKQADVEGYWEKLELAVAAGESLNELGECTNCGNPEKVCNASGCGQRQRPGWRQL